ncbi:hypothetical protein MJO28_003659 [Puccinia striiformis f. sp. tritici]|uniref:Uncharacterized protein n=1 Tax=Puccinia striiformis f. sp. tritici TaxID=168172 RepID=A0ACC0EP23_9BASI|nr:hypothetical protein MJO28_003659 [Puccinia striiformis f. sp. tritici]
MASSTASSPHRKSTPPTTASNRSSTQSSRSSTISTPAKPPIPTTTAATAKRLSKNINTARSNSVPTHVSADELERERAKVSSLKALINAAEEKESDATAECAIWRSKADQLSTTIDRMEVELVQAQQTQSQYERVTKELEKLKAAHKELERIQFQQTDEFEASKAAWAEEEATLKVQLSNSNSQLAELQKQYAETDDPESVPSLPVSPVKPIVSSESPQPMEDVHTATALLAELEAMKAQQATNQALMEQALTSADTLKTQLADLERVNEQLMDDNESYQILVGERTLMGGFDIKQLLRVDESGSTLTSTPAPRRASPTSSLTPSLEGVEEEDEEEDDEDEDPDAAIERAVLESHGDGSRTTGAVEAGISKTAKPQRNRGNAPTGLGLDLAAELAQAEETEGHQDRKVELEERKRTKKINKEKEQEIKALQDTNKALVLYISKILDRISAHDGFEKVLSNDYSKDGISPTRLRTRSATTAHHTVAASGPQSAKAGIPNIPTVPTNQGAKRSSWLQYFTGIRSPPPPTTNIKPLRLGTGASVTPGPSTLSAGLKSESDEDDPEACERERRIAEMKLHGTYKANSPTGNGKPQDATIRANRRSSSMYGTSQSSASAIAERRRNSGEIVGASKLSLLPSIDSSLVPLTQAGLLKRNEEREKESRINLEKGQASGFTEIEIRGHRMRPSANRQSTTPNHPLSPVSQSSSANSPGKHSSPSANTTPVAPGGIKDLKMTADLNNNTVTAEPVNQGLLARTARRISMMGGGK